MSNRGINRRSMGAELYLPHLKPKGTETHLSPRASNRFGVVGNGKLLLESSDVASQ